jgi:glyoxylase-like metal-dependent hydrolase (beta-lactamase superfamily II)
MKRRDILKSLAVAAATISPIRYKDAYATEALLTNAIGPRAGFEEIKEVSKNVFFAQGNTTFFKNGNFNEVQSNNGWIVFDDFVLIIDANFPSNANLLYNEIRRRTDKPIKLVFNTHHHGDHLYGNNFWVQKGATPIAFTGLVDELIKYETGYFANRPGRWESVQQKRNDLKGHKLFPPSLTFDKKNILKDKNTHVELIHLGVGHTYGDAVAWLPKEKILFVGDACLNGPFNLFRDAHIQSWINTLEIMKSYKPIMVIGGHGTIGDENSISKQQSYLKHVLDWVKTEKNQNNSWDRIQIKLPILRNQIENNSKASHYLIQEPSVVSGFSLEAHAKKIFEELEQINKP